MILEIFEDLKIWTMRFVDNKLAIFNNSLDKLLMGSLYIFLFSTPKCFNNKSIIFFRLLSIIPIIYIIEFYFWGC